MAETSTGKRKGSYYKGGEHKRSKNNVLESNMRGFLCTCNNREKDCIYESYNLLNRYADALYGCKEDEKCKDGDEDVSDKLASEVESLKEDKSSLSSKRFQVVKCGAKNVIFIRTTIENPVELAEKIVADVQRTKQQQARFLLRLIPIETSCKAYIKDIKQAIQPLLEKYFKDQPRTFSVVFNHRNNSNLSRDEVIKEMADAVAATRSDHKVNLKEAELTVVVEVVRGTALLAVIPDFLKYKKYNLQAFCNESCFGS